MFPEQGIECMPAPFDVVSLRERIPEVFAIAAPIRVEPDSPVPRSRESDCVRRIRSVAEVQDHHDVISGATLVPSVKGDHLVVVADVKHVDVAAAQAAGVVEPISTQAGSDRDRGDRCRESVSYLFQSIRWSPNGIHSRISCPWKIMGMPALVNTIAAPSVDRFFDSQLSARPGWMSSGSRRLPLLAATSSCDSV